MLPIHPILHPTDCSKPSDYPPGHPLARSRLRRPPVRPARPPRGGAARVVLRSNGGVVPPDRGMSHRPRAETPPDSGIQPGASRRALGGRGHPPEAILRLAGEGRCDLIVMGAQGRKGMERLRMGSVAEEVMRKGRCPALTAKDPRPALSPESSANDLESTASVPSPEGAGVAESRVEPDRGAAVHGTTPWNDPSSVVVDDAMCAFCAVPTKRVHHREFPGTLDRGRHDRRGGRLPRGPVVPRPGTSPRSLTLRSGPRRGARRPADTATVVRNGWPQRTRNLVHLDGRRPSFPRVPSPTVATSGQGERFRVLRT